MKIFKKKWYLQYTPEITEELFNNILLVLKQNDIKPYIHCGFNISYSKFKEKKYLRSGEGDPKDLSMYCIDNNTQGGGRELFIKDFLLEEIYQIY